MTALLGRVVLVTGPCFSLLGIFLVIPFWPVVFPLRNQLLALLKLPCVLLSVFSLLLLRFSLWVWHWHFNYDMSWSGPLWVDLDWDPLWTCMAFPLSKLRKFSVIILSNRFLSLVPFLLLVFLWFECCCLSCCLAVPLSYLHIFFSLCVQLLYLSISFYFVFHLTNSVLCFIQPACNSF